MRSWLGLIVLGTLAASGSVRATTTSALPAWPVPPRQHTSWIAPRGALPRGVVSAAETLFSQGMADPRECEYRVITIPEPSSTGMFGSTTRETHGWVLPDPQTPARFAVGWDGLLHPAYIVGAPANLLGDVLEAIQPIERARKGKRPDVTFGFRRGHDAATAASNADRLRAVLLVRLGYVDLARRMWSACEDQPLAGEEDPYLDLARDWLWNQFNRALAAHMRGEDPLARTGLRFLTKTHPDVEAEAARRGFERPDREASDSSDPVPYIGFGITFGDLLADQDRRAPPASRPENLTKGERIATLIRDLSEIAERQLDEPGYPPIESSPIVKALIREGDAAVRPLIDCLEHDERLTRSVSFWRSYARQRNVVPVREAAFCALSAILQTTEFGHEPKAGWNEGWRLRALQIRSYWDRYGALPLAERWYGVLSDDAAGTQRWLEAAASITSREEPADPESSPLERLTRGGGRENAQLPLRGATLRSKTAPSLLTLLGKRIAEVAAGLQEGEHSASSDAVVLALRLSTWDPTGAVPALRREFRRCAALSRIPKKQLPTDFSQDANTQNLAELTLARMRGKDPTGLSEYLRWLAAADPSSPGASPNVTFEPLWSEPEHPHVPAAARALFTTPGSRWRRAVERLATSSFTSMPLVHTPLLGFASFRQLVIRLLGDRAHRGVASLDGRGGLNVDWVGGGSSFSGHDPSLGPLVPRPGAKVRFRRCDEVAHDLSSIGGAPQFELYWPLRARDAAVQRMIGFLKAYGPRLRHSPLQDQMGVSSYEPVPITFPRLSKPAAPADVLAHRAIFSLTGRGVRAMHLPRRPLRARWTTLRKYPNWDFFWSDGTEPPRLNGYHQDGWVWQAEEQSENGRRKCYYGFVGPHEIARVPGAEIEFPIAEAEWPGVPSYDWRELTHGLDCLLSLGPQVEETDNLPELKVPPTVELQLRNRRGAPLRVPVTYSTRQGSRVLLSKAVEVRLWHTPDLPASSHLLDPAAEARRKWMRLEPLHRPQAVSGARQRTLQPTESFTALELNLGELFDLKEPGLYRVQMRCSRAGGLGDGATRELQFMLRPTGEQARAHLHP
jgi:hypothetical protein